MGFAVPLQGLEESSCDDLASAKFQPLELQHGNNTRQTSADLPNTYHKLWPLTQLFLLVLTHPPPPCLPSPPSLSPPTLLPVPVPGRYTELEEVLSRLGRSQGLLYKQLCHSFTDSFVHSFSYPLVKISFSAVMPKLFKMVLTVTAILLNGWIVPTGGVASGRVWPGACAAGLFK